MKQMMHENCETVFKNLDMKCERFGDNIYSTCPIHEGSDNPRAFSYSVSRGMWKCWTRDCQNHYKNDLIGLVTGALSAQSNKEYSFVETVKWIAKALNIKLDLYNKAGTKQSEDAYSQEINSDFSELVNIFNNGISLQPEIKSIHLKCHATQPSPYFLTRGFNANTLDYFEVGDCIDKESKMRNRAIIPIHDDNGKNVIGLIGRTTKEYITPKFLLYPKGFDKRFWFYNYHRAIDMAKKTSCLYIAEGQGDVWRLYEAGVRNAVSIFGKTISTEQEDKLYKLPVTHLIILTDNDQAGREAKVQIQRRLGRSYKLTFPKMYNKDIGEMTVAQIENKILATLKGTY